MRKLLLVAVVLGTVAGCKNAIGPRQSRDLPPADDPLFSIPEQEKRGRLNYSLPEDNRLVPNGFIDRPGPTGR